MATADKPKTRMRKSYRRQTILLAATQAFVEGGPEAVSMERVAAMIGISRAVLYDHFPSRSALLVAIHDDYAQFLNEKVLAAVANVEDDLEALAAASVRGYFDAVAERGIFNRMLTRVAGADPEMLESQRRLRQSAVEGTTRRLLTLLDVDGARLRLGVAMTLSLMEQAATLWLAGECERDEAERLYVDMAVPALRALTVAPARST